ncbi:MAG: hypothetical protein JWR18_623, partial [Segetibacter sp.]|nr:hypothetical protein [Segetibacter sp.]
MPRFRSTHFLTFCLLTHFKIKVKYLQFFAILMRLFFTFLCTRDLI